MCLSHLLPRSKSPAHGHRPANLVPSSFSLASAKSSELSRNFHHRGVGQADREHHLPPGELRTKIPIFDLRQTIAWEHQRPCGNRLSECSSC